LLIKALKIRIFNFLVDIILNTAYKTKSKVQVEASVINKKVPSSLAAVVRYNASMASDAQQ